MIVSVVNTHHLVKAMYRVRIVANQLLGWERMLQIQNVSSEFQISKWLFVYKYQSTCQL